MWFRRGVMVLVVASATAYFVVDWAFAGDHGRAYASVAWWARP